MELTSFQTTEAQSINVVPELHFVSVGGTQPLSRNEQRDIRAFVMRQYVQKKKIPGQGSQSTQVHPMISSYKSRFRYSRREPPKRTQGKAMNMTATILESKNSQEVPAEPPLFSMDLNNTKLVPTIYDHSSGLLNPLHNFQPAFSDIQTLALLQYYHGSFWANSYACNPRGNWISIALMEPATLHATLTLVAIHRRDCFSLDLNSVYFRHRGQVMRLIAEQLENLEGVSEMTIGAVAILSSSDNHFDWSSKVQDFHINGLQKLVNLRGGIELLNSNKDVQRVAGWADLLHAAVNSTHPRFPLPSFISATSVDELAESAMSDHFMEPQLNNLVGLPQRYALVIQQLRKLVQVKALLQSRRTPQLCQVFSDLLWKFEHYILDATRYPTGTDEFTAEGEDKIPTDDVLWHSSIFKALGVAALILSYSRLRDLAAPVIFRKLSKHLRRHISRSFLDSAEESFDSDFFASSNRSEDISRKQKIAILLWILFQGWRGSWENENECHWFSTQAARVCLRSVSFSDDRICAILNGVVSQEPDLASKSKIFSTNVQQILRAATDKVATVD
ncbi:hypothetical protein H2198_003523 [Neophaeococcomyces mojaviensis]|uniref:Uncharacterized protein n=1 Tax=Neophaeococcomyces mojaviensis TaxID=3383035 RepID=A0ACC3AB87_9EURO|nr:hypothetical protein H2198_003523 [Knufia sp. JES_112]